MQKMQNTPPSETYSEPCQHLGWSVLKEYLAPTEMFDRDLDMLLFLKYLFLLNFLMYGENLLE